MSKTPAPGPKKAAKKKVAKKKVAPKKKTAKKKAAPKKKVAKKKAAPKKKVAKKKVAKKAAPKKKVARSGSSATTSKKKTTKKKAAKKAVKVAPRLLPEGSPAILLVISGPSGAGKSTLARNLANAERNIWRSVSMTTRAPREGERNYIDYIFVSHEEFEAAIKEGKFLEYAQYGTDYYGTPREVLLSRLTQGRDALLEIDVQGAAQVRMAAADAVNIFIRPPSRSILENRLRLRGTETEERIAARLARVDAEISEAAKYDYLIINDDLDRACAELQAIISAERNAIQRRIGIPWQDTITTR